jgi:hypothetical protein
VLVSVKLGNLESSLGKVLEASRKLRVVGRGLLYVVGAKFLSDRSLVELVRAGVKTGGCVCVSLCWVSATGFQEYSKAKRPTLGLVTRGTLVGFSFDEMKSGLGKKGKGAHTEMHMASASVHAAPLNVLSSGFKPTLFPGCEITQRQISFHTPRRRQRSTGKIGQFPRGARGPTRRTWRLI